MKFAAALFTTLCVFASGHAAPAPRDSAPTLESARRQAAAVLETIAGAAAPSAVANVERDSLGANLAHYANNPGSDPARFESMVEAARRILAGGTTQKRAPDATALWLN